MAILKIRDAEGNVWEILAIKGEKGDKGDPGEFTGGELLNAHINNKENPHEMTAEQVGARPDTWMPTAAEVGARPDTWTPTAADVGARPDTWMPTAVEVGARPDTWTPTAADVGAAPAGYGLGTNAVNPQTLDSIAANGYYEKAIDFGNGNGGQSCIIWHSQFGDGKHADQFATVILGADQGSTFHRIKYDGAWHGWTKVITAANFNYVNGTLSITV